MLYIDKIYKMWYLMMFDCQISEFIYVINKYHVCMRLNLFSFVYSSFLFYLFFPCFLSPHPTRLIIRLHSDRIPCFIMKYRILLCFTFNFFFSSNLSCVPLIGVLLPPRFLPPRPIKLIWNTRPCFIMKSNTEFYRVLLFFFSSNLSCFPLVSCFLFLPLAQLGWYHKINTIFTM